ncbi:7413_t:CDS:10 [Rhizophagus irregularis]|nr:7413_t:CDS:10 [Rhizophagus irregularis]
MHNYVTSPEQNAQQHGSSNQASINNILQRPSTTTRTMPHEFTLDQGNQSAKRRKSGGSTYVNPPSHQSDQAYMQQGPYHFIQPSSSLYFSPITSINPPITVRNNSSILRPQPLTFADALSQRSQSHTISNNNIFNNSDKPQALQSSNQVISNQNNHHVPVSSQIIPQQIGFQNQIQISNNNTQQQISQQQMLQQQHGNNQGQMQQISLEILRPSTSGQITLYPIPQIQQPLHTSIMDNPMYNSDNISTPNISSTQDSIQHIYQRLESLKVDLDNKDYFQSNCDELYNYLQDGNVYNSYQELLVQCLRCVKNRASYGFEAASKVFQSAMINIGRFNLNNQSLCLKYFIYFGVILKDGTMSQPRIEQRPSTDIEKANANWISRIIDRAWGHVMLPYESQMINQHQSQQEFINSFYVPHEKFERIWRPETPFPPVHVHPNKLPISYRLISRKPSNLDEDNKCDWPPEEATFKIHINDSEIKLSRKQRIPIKQNQYSFVGVDKPVDIVQYLVAGVNRIKITQCMCEPCRQQLSEHILSIEILAKETEEIVLRNARSQTLTIEHGTEIVKRLISGPSSSNQQNQPTSPASSIGTGQNNVAMLIDDDCDITVNKMKVSLRCPLSLLRISEPAKGQNCRHIGKNCKWRCPECNDRVTSETLRIDEYFKSLLRQIPGNVNTVEMDSSGKWTVVGQDEGDGGDTTDDDDVMQIDANSKRSSLPSTSSKSDKASAAIIILDDDDEPEPQTSNNNQQVPLLQSNVQPLTTLQSFVQPQRPKAMRQSSTPGVPYMQHRPNIQTNDQLQSSILIQSPPPSANMISTTTIMQSPPDTTMYMDPTRTNNNNIRKRKPRKSRRKELER